MARAFDREDLDAMGDGELLSLKTEIEALLEGRRREERERQRREGAERRGEGGRWIEFEHTNCGKCPRCAAGLYVHGPYWYLYEYTGGKTRSKYLGRSLTEGKAEEHGFPELAGLRPEDAHPVEVAAERAETERRYAEIVAERRAKEGPKARPVAPATGEPGGAWAAQVPRFLGRREARASPLSLRKEAGAASSAALPVLCSLGSPTGGRAAGEVGVAGPGSGKTIG